jgi:hypothetical protein
MVTGRGFPPLPNRARLPSPRVRRQRRRVSHLDRLGVLNTIDWQGFRVDGRTTFRRSREARRSTQAFSKNMSDLYPQGGEEIDLITHIADRIRYIEGNLYWDVTPEIRFQTAGIYTTVTYLDGQNPHNIRGKFSAYYFF